MENVPEGCAGIHPAYAKRLIIFTNGDFTSMENGSHLRMAQQIEFASEHLRDVVVYSHRQHPTHAWDSNSEARFRERFPRVGLILEDAPPYLRWVTRAKNAAIAFAPSIADVILRAAVPGGPAQYAELRSDPRCVFFLNFIDSCTVLNGTPKAFIVETHDVRFVKQSKKMNIPVYSPRILGKMRSEVAMLEQASAAVSISPVDLAILSSITRKPEHFFVPSYDVQDPVATLAEPRVIDLLFVGANNNFNVTGLCEFIRANEAWLSGRRLSIVGKICENQDVKQCAEGIPSIKLLGFVEDVAAIYAKAKAVISPVDGTGLKMKVVDALAHGKPVFGSAHSLDALPQGFEECVLPLRTGLMDRILDDPQELFSAEEAARLYYQNFVKSGDRANFLFYLTQRLHIGSR